MAELEIVGPRDDVGVRLCRLACLEKNLPYRYRELSGNSASAKRENLLGILPALRHGKVRLFGARSITHYIDGRFTNSRSLVPADIIRASEVEQWIALIDGKLNHLTQPASEAGRISPQEVPACLHAINEGIGNRMFLVGRGFTLADLWLLPVADAIQHRAGSEKLLKAYPALGLWIQKHSGRKSWKSLLQAEEQID